jgi:hypothetical protein
LDSDVRNDPVWLHQLITKAQRTASVA